MMPPSGDELLNARQRRVRDLPLSRATDVEERAEFARRVAESAGRIAGLAECADRREAARKLAQIFAECRGPQPRRFTFPRPKDRRSSSQSGVHGTMPNRPRSPTRWARDLCAAKLCEVIPLSIRRLAEGHVLLYGMASEWGQVERSACELMAGQGATTLALLGERERSTRGAIKDLTTSAYTFAYFVDIAGREIDKARRYGRRFALATIALDEEPAKMVSTSGTSDETSNASTDLAEVILGVVRDTDVLARVDEREFYLLMPETGGVGAQSCRRRVLQSAATRAGRPGTRGVPRAHHRGFDLSPRRERISRSCTRGQAPRRDVPAFGRATDQPRRGGALGIGGQSDAFQRRALKRPGVRRRRVRIELSCATPSIAVSAVSEALRGGPTFVAVAHHPELGLSSSVRAHLGHERGDLSLHILDFAQRGRLRRLADADGHRRAWGVSLVGRSDGVGMRGVHGWIPFWSI